MKGKQLMNSIVVGYHDKSLKKVLFHAGTGFYVSDVQSAKTFANKKEAKVVAEEAKKHFVKRGRKDVKLTIFRVSLKEA